MAHALRVTVVSLLIAAGVAGGSALASPALGKGRHQDHAAASRGKTHTSRARRTHQHAGSRTSTRKSRTRKHAHRHGANRKVLTLAGTDPVLLGDQTIESSSGNALAGSAAAFPFSGQLTGTATSISVYVDFGNHASELVAGLYNDKHGRPGSLLATGSLSLPTAGAWNTLSVNSTSVTAGRKYWIAILGRGGALYYRDHGSGPCTSVKSSKSNLASLPTPWSTGAQSSSCPVSAYVSGFDAPPSNTGLPTISGSAVQGQTLSASTGTWSNSPTSYAYQWQHCSTTAGCAKISGAISSSYVLASSDVGDTVDVVVTASTSGGSGAATSAETAVVGTAAFLANDKFVAPAPTGSDSNDGSQAHPYATITKCASVITAGHTCWIENGTYSDINVCPANSGTSESARVTISAYPGASPIMEGSGRSAAAFLCFSKNYVTIRGLTIRDYDPPQVNSSFGGGGAIAFITSLSPVVEHNVIYNTTWNGNDEVAGVLIKPSASTYSPLNVSYNYIDRVVGDSSGSLEADGVWVAPGDISTGIISHNVISDGYKDDIRAECGPSPSSTVGSARPTTYEIQDNILTHAVQDGVEIDYCYATSINVSNNFVGWNGQAGIKAKHTVNVAFANNTVYAGSATADGTWINGDTTAPGCTDGQYGTLCGADWNLKYNANIFSSDYYAGWSTSRGYTLPDGTHPYADYDVYYASGPAIWNLGGNSYTSLSSLQSGTGWEPHGMVTNPMFTSPSTGDFTLQTGSAATGRGAAPSQLTGVGPDGTYSLAKVPLTY